MVYDLLRDHTITWRNLGLAARENGHGMLYLPKGSVLRAMPDEDTSVILQMRTELKEIFGISDSEFSFIPGKAQSAQDLAYTILARYPERRTVLFEGYAIDSAKEGADFHSEVVKVLRTEGVQVLWSKPSSVDMWNNKLHSRAWFAETFGKDAIPTGKRLEVNEVQDTNVPALVAEVLASSTGKVIVKRNGGGGLGNLIITSDQDYSTELDAFLAKTLEEKSWVSIEEWVPWIKSGCCSCFIDNDGGVTPIAVVEQILSQDGSAGFIGSRFTDLAVIDQNALFEYVKKLGEKLYQDGIRGFAGFDFIILDESVPVKFGLKLPSDNRFMFVEVTPRTGGHNQELRFVDLLENRWKISGLYHFRVGTPHFGGRHQIKAKVSELLGIPYLTEEAAKEMSQGFFVDGHMSKPAIYDSVIVVGTDKNQLLQQLDKLREAGLTR